MHRVACRNTDEYVLHERDDQQQRQQRQWVRLQRAVRRLLAADLTPGATPADLAALGFLGVSPDYWKELQLDVEVIKAIVADEWEERIDAVGGWITP